MGVRGGRQGGKECRTDYRERVVTRLKEGSREMGERKRQAKGTLKKWKRVDDRDTRIKK